MGDVFDAMNRSKREQEPSGSPQDRQDSATPPSGGPEQPALPLEQVQSQAQRAAKEDARPTATLNTSTPSPATPATDHQPVASAQQRHESLANSAAVHQPDARLNGYSHEVVVHHDRGSLITEQYRAIRTQILARARNRRLQTHVITSSTPQEGKTVTCLNLGMAFAELRNQKTLLIEGDLRRPTFEKYFDRECKPGLIQLLQGKLTQAEQAIHPTVYDNLFTLPAGGVESEKSTELLSSPRMAQLLDRLKDHYDHIFIDTPPVITVTDAAILGALCDQTILVVRLNKTPTDMIDRSKRLLRAANCEVAGVVLTHLEKELSHYLYRGGYSYVR